MIYEETADMALAALKRDLIEELALSAAVQLAGGDPGIPAPQPRPRPLTPRQLGLAEAANPDLPVTPEDPAAEKWCGYCGNSDEHEFGQPDLEHLGDKAERFCADEHLDACLARRTRRYPPRPDLVEPVILELAGHADGQEDEEPTPVLAAGQDPAVAARLELARSQAGRQEVSDSGSFNPTGGYRAPADPWIPVHFDHWGHTIRGGAHTGHLISGGARWPGHSGAQGHLGTVAAAQQPAEPAGAAQRPRRRGRRLAYTPRRRQTRRAGQRAPESVDGSDAFSSGGMDTGGPGGGAEAGR
jgi:hypothetical protein